MCLFMDVEAEIAAVVGLGNPGLEYSETRHNVGFRVIERLARELGISLLKESARLSWGVSNIEGRPISLFKPLAFMNRSGEVVSEILKRLGLSARQMLVIHDDLDLSCGRIRVVQRGGAGGHRGVLSIVEHLGHQDFPRMKLGIGRPMQGESIEEYVLQAPYPEQRDGIEEMVEMGAKAAQDILSSGLVAVMNRVNRRKPQV